MNGPERVTVSGKGGCFTPIFEIDEIVARGAREEKLGGISEEPHLGAKTAAFLQKYWSAKAGGAERREENFRLGCAPEEHVSRRS